MSKLFSPFLLRSLELANRIVVSPMCQYSAVDGRAQRWHSTHYGQLAMSGAGMIIVEASAVEPAGRITAGCLGLYDDATEAAARDLLDAVRDIGPTRLCVQIAHAGRKASSGRPWEGGQLVTPDLGGWQTVGPSAVPHLDNEAAPRELSRDDLKALKARFIDAVLRANRAGYDAIELHAAHGYLMHEFLSPIANRREDEYGGSLENRMRYPLEIFGAMRAAWPAHKPLGIRVSCTDWVDGGWDLAGTIAFAKQLERLGCDWIDASSGGVSPRQKIAIGPGYQVPFGAALRKEVKVPIMTVGLITEPQQAEDIVAGEQADLVALGRTFLSNPRWPWDAAAALGGAVHAPRQYWRAPPAGSKTAFGSTSFGTR